VERDHERSVLAHALDGARAERGGVVVIEAVAGAGKTSLLDLAEGLARERAMRVLRARAAEATRDVPLAVLRGLFQRQLAELPRRRLETLMEGPAAVLAGALGLGEPRPLTDLALHHAAYWLVADMAGDKPLVLLVDDLQWADPASVAALAAVGSRLDDLPVVLVLTHRSADDGEMPDELCALSLSADARLHPAGLTRAGVAALLRNEIGTRTVDEATAQLGFEATGGNPFLVVQLAVALADRGTQTDLCDLTAAVSTSLSSVLRMRVRRHGPDAVALAHAVVVLGDECDLTAACAVASVSRESALRAAAALASNGIFARDRVTSFAHPLVRAAIDSELVAAERTRLRERAAAVLLEADSSDVRAVHHLLHTVPAADARAVVALRAAASSATAAAAPRRASILLRRAIAETAPARPDDELFDQLIGAELAGAEFEHATAHIRERLAGSVPPVLRGELVSSLGRVVMQTDGIAAAVKLMDQELQGLEGEGRLLAEAEQAWMFTVYPPLAHRLDAFVAAYATLPGRTAGERAMLAMVGLAMSLAAERPASVVTPILTRAFGDGALLADRSLESAAHATAGYALLLTEQLDLAEREMSRAVDAARKSGSTGLCIALVMRALARLHAGRIADAEADGLAAIELGAASPGTLNDVIAAAAAGVVVDARTERGDDVGAIAALVDCGLVGDLAADPELRALLPRARAHLAAGRAAEALADAVRAAAGYQGFQDVMNHSAIVEALAYRTLGDRDAALEAGTAQLVRARAWGTPSVVATALRVTGWAHGGRQGIEMLEEAVAVLESSPALLERARCLLALGMLRRRARERVSALDALRQSADLGQRLGARRVAELARAELRILGARPRRLAFSGADSLTAAQLRVAQLAAANRSNREIAQELYVSMKTVEGHLSQTYNKLGIASRGELAAALTSARGDPA
jgi:DNA-binding CsgD family transcriptional regulator